MALGDSGTVLLMGEVALAKFIAELVRQGVTFKADQTAPETFRVTLTGGY